MHISELKAYYPAGSRVSHPIEVFQVKASEAANTWVGEALLPNTEQAQKVVIFGLTMDCGEEEYRLVPAACPHQGFDISRDILKNDGNVYCSLHRRPICIYSEYNQAYQVKREGEQYFIV